MAAKILFYTKLDFGNEAHSGISKKIFAQAKALRRLGIETDLLYFRGNEVVVSNGEQDRVFAHNSTAKRVLFQFFGFTAAIDLQQYSHIYIRHFFLHPIAMMALRRIKKINPKAKLIMEIASYPYHQQARKGDVSDQFRYKLDRWFCGSLKKYIDCILTYSEYDRIFDIPTIKTSNGVDIDGLSPKKVTPLLGEFHILGLANVQHWHGFDRVIQGLKKYEKQKELPVFFHIVGKGDAIESLKRLSKGTMLERCVLFHGAKHGAELQTFFNNCHIGISSLGMHRVGASRGEWSTLKVREYCARGIPFINGYLDRDLPLDFPYTMQVNADDSAVNIEKAIDFYRNLLEIHPDYPTELHAFAQRHLTWEAKFADLKKWVLSP